MGEEGNDRRNGWSNWLSKLGYKDINIVQVR